MRKIKFRGKTKNGEWVQGYLVNSGHQINPYVEFWWIAQNRYDFGTVFNEKSCDDTFIWNRVEPDTIGQYTGLKDKNGIEIYDGDIVRTMYKEFRDFGDEKADYFTSFVEEVVWLPVFNGFGLVYHIADIPVYRPLNYTTEIRGVKLIEVEVIGNKYDNPELLEEK